MNLESASGIRRRKSSSRRIGREVRLWLPLLGFACCYSLSATAIVVSERTTIESRDARETHLTISISSTSNDSAAPGRMRGGAPRLP
jgi:hypothetical protein